MKTCAECQYWNLFDGCCWCVASTNYMHDMDGDTQACEDFDHREEYKEVFPPEEIEQENEDDA